MIAYSFFFHVVHWSLSNHFCEACQNCLHPSPAIWHTKQCGRTIVAIMQHKQRLLKQNQFDIIKIIAVERSMAKYELTVLRRLIVLSCNEISFVISFFQFWESLSQTGITFLQNSMKLILKTWKKLI